MAGNRREFNKIVLIGAGSSEFTCAVLGGLVSSPHFQNCTVGLVDIDEEVLALMDKLTRRLTNRKGLNIKVESSTDRRDVLPGADAVIVTIAAGGVSAWENDLKIPEKYGIVQPVGDTVGPGGLSRALRHVPIMVEIAQDMEELCPDAWLFNFTNPMSALCRAVTRETSIKAMGLCIGVELIRRYMASLVGIPLEETKVWAAGINHFMWAQRFHWNGRDAFPLVAARLRELSGEEPGALDRMITDYPGLEMRTGQPFWGFQKISHFLFERFGMFPGPGDSHIIEFMSNLARLPAEREKYGIKLFPIDYKKESRSKLMMKLAAQVEGETSLELETFGDGTGEEQQVVSIMSAMLEDTDEIFYVNLPNQGYITNIPDGYVVEVPTMMGAYECKPISCGELPSEIAGIITHWINIQELMIDAALVGSRKIALQALLLDPIMCSIDGAEAMLDELIAANAAYLPRFR